MGRTYFCEFCNKTFTETLISRKRHLESEFHKNSKRVYFEQFNDPRTVYEREKKKQECRKYFTGQCQFGLFCLYSHFSEQELNDLKKLADESEKQKQAHSYQLEIERCYVPTYESWKQKREEKLNSDDDNQIDNDDYTAKLWVYPKYLEQIPDLPPSLLRMTSKSFENAKFEEWG